jgi:Invasion associated locus B (IalB) protein
MRIHRGLALLGALAVAAAFAVGADAQQQAAPPAQSPAQTPHAAKPKNEERNKPPAAAQVKPTLLGQYGEWGAYTASPGGKKVCFVIAKPTSAETNPPHRLRGEPYFFVSTRPAEKVVNEVSIDFGYPLKHDSQASVQVGQTTYALYTEGSGAWIKNAGEEVHMVGEMRGGGDAVVRGVSTHGTQTTDTYALKGLSEALDRVAKECK